MRPLLPNTGQLFFFEKWMPVVPFGTCAFVCKSYARLVDHPDHSFELCVAIMMAARTTLDNSIATGQSVELLSLNCVAEALTLCCCQGSMCRLCNAFTARGRDSWSLVDVIRFSPFNIFHVNI